MCLIKLQYLRCGQVETPEAVEVLAINTLAPFILNGKLRSHMEKSPFPDRHIVNVRAVQILSSDNLLTSTIRLHIPLVL